MNELQEYINEKYDGNAYWFEDEVQDTWHIDRIMNALNIMEYIDGKHEILKREDVTWKGKIFKTRKIVLQYVKPILTFQNSFLLKNPVTLTSDDKETLEVYKEIYKVGKYNNIDAKILDSLLKYGEVYEYVYLDEDRKIKSHIIKSCDSYPVYNSKGDYIAFIEHYISDGISYYTIYTNEKVEEWNNKGGELHKTDEFTNLTGLPIRYLLPSETDELKPRSDLQDWIGIIDNMEDLISKYMDSFYKFLNPLPVFTGTKLSTGKNGEGAIDPNLVGQALQLDFGSKFEFAVAEMDYQSFKEVYKTLHQCLLNISMTPAISMNSMEISNLSETSMKILFYMAIAKANMTAKHLYEGFDERWKKMKQLLKLIDKDYQGYISCTFKFDIPANDSEIIDNLKKLYEMGTISLETLLSQSPYIYDVTTEMQRLNKDKNTIDDSGIVDD